MFEVAAPEFIYVTLHNFTFYNNTKSRRKNDVKNKYKYKNVLKKQHQYNIAFFSALPGLLMLILRLYLYTNSDKKMIFEIF